MVKQNLSQKSTAHTFFKEQAPLSIPAAEFSASLREKVLERYINYNDQDRMENAFVKKRNNFIFASLFAVIAIGLSVFLILNNRVTETINSNPTNKIAGDLAYTEGTVVYKTLDADWQVAPADTMLTEGSSLKVAGEGRAILNLDDGSSVRLNDNSQITLASLDANNIIILNDSGEVYTRVVKAERSFEVRADSVTYKSLGTAYKTIKTDNLKGVEVYDSKVSVKNEGSADIVVEQGQKYFIENKFNAEEQQKVLAVDIDYIKQDEFIIWNKDQDVKIAEYKENLGILNDFEPPVLTVSSPENNVKTYSERVDISGTTEIGARVFINGNEVANDGTYIGYVGLNMGENKITVKSMDANGNKTFIDLIVIREAVAQQTPTPTPQPQGSWISLSGYATKDGIQLNWDVAGLDVSNGFKVIKGYTANPSYPGDHAEYVSKASARSHSFWIMDGKTYNFRVCQYNGNGGCNWYSNNISVTAPTKQVEQPKPQPQPISSVSSISLFASGVNVNWTTVGTAKQGYKVTWSQQSGPTYPARNGDYVEYLGDPNSNSFTVPNWKGAGVYYVRVCEYVDGTCKTYSNEVAVTVL